MLWPFLFLAVVNGLGYNDTASVSSASYTSSTKLSQTTPDAYLTSTIDVNTTSLYTSTVHSPSSSSFSQAPYVVNATEKTTTFTTTGQPITVNQTVTVSHHQTVGTSLKTSDNVVYSESLYKPSQLSFATTPVLKVVSVPPSLVSTSYSTVYAAPSSASSVQPSPVIISQVSASSQPEPLITGVISTASASIEFHSSQFTGVAVVAPASPAPASPASPASPGAGTSAGNSVGSSGSYPTRSPFANTTSNSSFGSSDLFSPISVDEPLSVFERKAHPLTPPQGVDTSKPVGTNKFYANFFLDKQTDPVWTNPYGVFYDKAKGMGVMYTPKSKLVLGTDVHISTKGADYLTSAVGVAGMLFSSKETGAFTLNVTDMGPFSVNVGLVGGSGFIEMPLTLGQGFVTGVYHGLTPLLQSSAGFKSLTLESSSAIKGISKYRATLFSGEEWLVYSACSLSVNGDNYLEGNGTTDSNGVLIQVAVAPQSTTTLSKRGTNGTVGVGSADNYYDSAAGTYIVGASINGSVSDDKSSAVYGFQYETAGSSQAGKPLVFAFPHQVQSLTKDSADAATGISLQSTTKGIMYGFITNSLTMEEDLNRDISFAPWSQQLSNTTVSWTKDQLLIIANAATNDLAAQIRDSVKATDTYTAGKVLDRFAYILYVVSDVLKDQSATQSALDNLKDAFKIFTSNTQLYPLFYDTTYKGVTSSANNNGDIGSDYSAGYYNDHHFHYGYYVHAAAIIGYVDGKNNGTWAKDNADWVNNLIRDVANPSSEDSYFPVSRMYDWFHGHSWAAGLFTSGAGKNQESSSEDYNFAYGMKLWGQVIGDKNMESRGDLMIAVTKRSMNNYMYYSDDNTIEPSQIVANKVSGIFYENKIAYTTFFGNNPEYIHGIHMLPITPVSSNMRGPQFVEEEWNEYIASLIPTVNSGWTGVLRMNQALYDPKPSYEYFSSGSFDKTQLDDGQSRTWCLAFTAALSNGVSN